jgi:membrane protein
MVTKFLHFLKNAVVQFYKNGSLDRASSLSYTTLFAMVPALAVNLLILSLLPNAQVLSVKIQHFVFNHLIADDGGQLQSYIAQFSAQIQHLSWISFIALFITVGLMMMSIEDAFNIIWKLESRPGRFALLNALMRHWGLVVFLPMLLGASLVVSSYFLSLHFTGVLNDLEYLQKIVFYLLPSFFVFVAFFALYKFLPAAHVFYRYATVGALVASILFEISKHLFFLYMSLFPTYQIIFGAFAVIPIFLLWIYIVWLIVLWGAQICYCLHPITTEEKE